MKNNSFTRRCAFAGAVAAEGGLAAYSHSIVAGGLDEMS